MKKIPHTIFQMDCETTDVIICGCGPTGALLSAQLGRSGVSNIVLEKELEITTDPRGIALDEDGIRALQGVGIYDKIYSEIGQCMGLFHFISGVHQVLDTKPFMKLDNSTTEGGTGHVGFICHKQPALEAGLRSAIASAEHSILRVGSTLTSISEDEDWVYITYDDKDANEHRLRGKFLVGADGKTGFTRKRYLEPKGVKMEQVSSTSYQSTWVALNWKITLPTEKTHPHFPLWRLGYTPEEVYNLFFPLEFRFLCNPERPAVCGRFGLAKDRLWRFEFEVQDGEDGMEMAGTKKIKEIVYPYVNHAGSRYGLANDVQYPDDCIQVLRSRPFWFSARSCNIWALDRVLLCGDSAHVFPPFGGQGIASGFRDASALAWRLQVACRPGFNSYQAAFRAWYVERKQQLERSLAATIRNGEFVTESNWLKIMIRDTTLWLMQLIPSWRRQLEMGHRAEGMVRYKYEPGITFLPDLWGGSCFPQVYCVPNTCEDFDEETATVTFTDDEIFANHKKGLLQLVVLVENADEISEARADLADVDRLSGGDLYAGEATFIIQKLSENQKSHNDKHRASQVTKHHTDVFRIASGSVFAASKLCLNRPAPRYYDPYRLKKETRGRKFVILRPDRFVFAACRDREELNRAVEQIASVLQGEGVAH